MRTGDVIADRFEIVKLASTGGMGQVFQANDRERGELVAVKVLLGRKAADRARFEREAEALSELKHPGIVEYVAHGEEPSGESYLVMEWLEGEDLVTRLAREALSVEETITLGKRVAETLGLAHSRGIIHRDLKPANLFLVDRCVEAVKVLDFGIAWLAGTTQLTQTGVLLGTPGYMAPEQALTGTEIDARADVFSFGCVLYECLTGARAFVGEHVMAVLAKILFEEVVQLREVRPDVPPWLDALVARMLAKEPARRPRHGLDVGEALSALDRGAASDPEAFSGPRSLGALSENERRLLSVVLLGREKPLGFDATQTAGSTGISPALISLRRIAEVSGGRLELLADGSVLVTLTGAGPATDLAARAALCALALRASAEDRPMALSTGFGEATSRLVLGGVIDRSARRLAEAASRARGAAEPAPGPIALDDLTAGLLDARFKVRRGEGGFELEGEHKQPKGARPALGKPTMFVGRDREIATLRALFNECVEEPVARVALVTGGPGIGKTRLAEELIGELSARAASPSMEVWMGRGDALQSGVAFNLLGHLLRRAAAIPEGAPLAARWAALYERLKRRVPASEQARVAEFIGEIAGVPARNGESSLLRTSRKDAELMAEQVRHAWEDFLAAECAAHPTLIVLDDLHFSDASSVRALGAPLGSQKAMPVMILGLARPEVDALFPKLWAEREVQQIRLDQLTRRASERLTQQALGPSAEPREVERILSLAEGNAFSLEELLRAVTEGKGEVLPETAVAMVEATLDALGAEARRVLRAASVFGEVFWQGGVEALLGGSRERAQAAEGLSLLVEREIVVERVESRYLDDKEFAFRSALLREGAYATLTQEDRALGHKLAAVYLAAQGEPDPLVLSAHHERGRARRG